MADKLNNQQFVVIRSASDAGALYGSVTTRDAAEAATADGFTIDRKQVVLGNPIKYLGLHDVTVNLHPEVEVSIQLNVARSVEEAEIQASGKSIQELAAEEEAAADFEISNSSTTSAPPRPTKTISPHQRQAATKTPKPLCFVTVKRRAGPPARRFLWR